MLHISPFTQGLRVDILSFIADRRVRGHRVHISPLIHTPLFTQGHRVHISPFLQGHRVDILPFLQGHKCSHTSIKG